MVILSCMNPFPCQLLTSNKDATQWMSYMLAITDLPVIYMCVTLPQLESKTWIFYTCIQKLQVLPIRFATFLYFGQNQKEMSAFFLCLILNVLLATTGLWNNRISHLCSGACQNGVVWWCLLISCSREGVKTNIDKQLKNVYGVTAVSCWAHKFWVLRKAEWCALFWLANNSSSYAGTASACSRTHWKQLTLQPESLQLSCQYPKEVWTTVLIL